MIRTLIPSLLLVVVAALPAAAGPVTFDFAMVGNAGNAADPEAGLGAVSYNYAISKTEVTNDQYAAFLNAVAATDNFGDVDPTLYNSQMGSNTRGGITRTGVPGSYAYATKPHMGNKPVIFVSFLDAMRFTNWLHNGQTASGTESGAYTIDRGRDEDRSTDARYWIPSEDEWYKAAYHDASVGTEGVYFDYATGTDSVPARATANSVGDINSPGTGISNYGSGASWNGQNGNVTSVGSAGPDSASPYGTFDQNGNVWEWSEGGITTFERGLHGGSWIFGSSSLRSSNRSAGVPTVQNIDAGFRVATVPEPGAVLHGIMAAACVLMMEGRRQRSSDNAVALRVPAK